MKLKALFIAATLVLGGILLSGLDAVHPFGVPGDVAMDEYFLDHAMEERSSENVVTSIVFDYRGFDTLGESAVLFTALCSVVMLFRKGRK
ncbi:putative monovalent cation/H+ antiporter subunit B [Dethiosulfovibrio peptidovorans DSM 11002]|jgi:multisubunit Na+/H+ antiporter MnhB subunit|uniref:Monovalent cation/H+ antiporter subunit B n=1 Tax=Dethiosulfovibrio peptidovorans DSM 11002 TaxID=469381 RepID=D2Z4W2_9BACT|nr:hydrogen gas-evolving membrane-bound hydrogenase subunit E [Dethiosulfovibrio peptidovorans]EFC92456.1 putative monovalent cation/H+ antiporter subunit B [Dethiosulfovibrio peptidovorans DSM 11002]